MQALARRMRLLCSVLRVRCPSYFLEEECKGMFNVLFAYFTHLIPRGGVKGWWATAFLSRKKYAPLAQLVEHLTLNQGVQGSSP